VVGTTAAEAATGGGGRNSAIDNLVRLAELLEFETPEAAQCMTGILFTPLLPFTQAALLPLGIATSGCYHHPTPPILVGRWFGGTGGGGGGRGVGVGETSGGETATWYSRLFWAESRESGGRIGQTLHVFYQCCKCDSGSI